MQTHYIFVRIYSNRTVLFSAKSREKAYIFVRFEQKRTVAYVSYIAKNSHSCLKLSL